MLYHAKNGTLSIDNTTMDYICFGTGSAHGMDVPHVCEGFHGLCLQP